MRNLNIRLMVSDNGLKFRDIAAEMGISPEWLSRLLRDELSVDNKIRIVSAIERLMNEKQRHGNDVK